MDNHEEKHSDQDSDSDVDIIDDDAWNDPSSFHPVFSDKIPVELTCVICQHLVTNAHSIDACGHTYCKTCIIQWTKIKKSCPSCATTIKMKQIRPSKILDRMINDIKVSCPFCEWTGDNMGFRAHIDPVNKKMRCNTMAITCTKCDEIMTSDSVNTHKSTCPKRLVPCTYCSHRIPIDSVKTHETEECTEMAMNACANSKECDFSGTKSEFDKHMVTCEYATTKCPMSHMGCRYSGERRTMSAHLEEYGLERHFAIAEECMADMKIELKNAQTKLLNYELPSDYVFRIGELVRVRTQEGFVIGEIMELQSVDDTYVVKVDNGTERIPRCFILLMQ
jgi:hypothetical protein